MREPDVAIIDSGGANLASLTFALARLGVSGTVTGDPERVRNASHVILPGVGAAAPAMERLTRYGFDEVIPLLSQPFLGICLGMQLLAEFSCEDDSRCLGIVPGRVRRLAASPDTPVPNMGWCRVSIRRPVPLVNGIRTGEWFYFVHSYALEPDAATVASAAHRSEFSAMIAQQNFFGTQFHPERSGPAGSRILKNFLGLGDAGHSRD